MALEATKGNMHMDTRVIEVTEFNFEVSLDLRGHLEATGASEAMKVVFRSNMQIWIRGQLRLLISNPRPISLPYRLQVYRAIALLFLPMLQWSSRQLPTYSLTMELNLWLGPPPPSLPPPPPFWC